MSIEIRLKPHWFYILLALSQSDLAGLVGASRVRVNQILVAYRPQGLIDIDRERRIIMYPDKDMRLSASKSLSPFRQRSRRSRLDHPVSA